MPLTWDASKVENNQELLEGKFATMTQELCFVLMAVGVSKITAENWQEVATRISLFEKVNGVTFTFWEQETQTETKMPIDAEFVKRHVGYTTNNSNTTKKQFLDKIWRMSNDDVETLIRIRKLDN